MFQPNYTDCVNCGTIDHNDYDCPCGCHGDEGPSRYRIKKATDLKSKEYWRFVEQVAREGPNPVRCDICGLTPTRERVIYARGKSRRCIDHYDAVPATQRPT